MTVKLTGAELNAFMTDAGVWKTGCWYDDAEFTVDGVPHELDIAFEGVDIIPVDAKVTLHGGAFYVGAEVNSPFYSLESELKKWLKARTVTIVTLEVANEHLAAFNVLIGSCRLQQGGKQVPWAKILK